MERLGQFARGDYQPHHIVPHGRYLLRSARENLKRSQEKLKSLGIGLDDAENGVYLKKGCHQSVGHTNNQFRRLDEELRKANTREAGIAALRSPGRELFAKCL